jgi:AraC family transcriptional regulator, exoenzyme S synthesis regulatory protein ExsA
VFNLHVEIAGNSGRYRQLRCGESLITVYNCPLQNKYEDVWSHCNYIVYVMEGRKIWHTAHGSYDLRPGSCVLVRKGANIVEQFFDVTFCLVLFFVPDEFICDVLKSKSIPIHDPGKSYDAIIAIDSNTAVQAFFQSMMHHFDTHPRPDPSLLELKFRELILTLAGNPRNEALLCYFHSLLKEPQSISLERVMEDNFCFNLKLEEFARLSSRSLSAFKRDFQQQFQTSPGR